MKVVKTVFTVIYILTISIVCMLLISKNEYNIHKLGKISIININENLKTKKYKEGSLVIVKELKKEELSKGQELFIYNESNSSVSIEKNNYEIEYKEIIGSKIIKINYLGNVIEFMQTKWMAFILIITLFSSILIYEIKSLISYSKNKPKKQKIDLEKTITILENKPGIKKINNLDEQVKELKLTTTSTNIFSEVVEDKNDKVEELMKELKKYKKEEKNIEVEVKSTKKEKKELKEKKVKTKTLKQKKKNKK